MANKHTKGCLRPSQQETKSKPQDAPSRVLGRLQSTELEVTSAGEDVGTQSLAHSQGAREWCRKTVWRFPRKSDTESPPSPRAHCSQNWKQGPKRIRVRWCSQQRHHQSPEGHDTAATDAAGGIEKTGFSRRGTLSNEKKRSLETRCHTGQASRGRTDTAWLHSHEVPATGTFLGAGSRLEASRTWEGGGGGERWGSLRHGYRDENYLSSRWWRRLHGAVNVIIVREFAHLEMVKIANFVIYILLQKKKVPPVFLHRFERLPFKKTPYPFFRARACSPRRRLGCDGRRGRGHRGHADPATARRQGNRRTGRADEPGNRRLRRASRSRRQSFRGLTEREGGREKGTQSAQSARERLTERSKRANELASTFLK